MQALMNTQSGIDWIGIATFWGLRIAAAFAIVLVGWTGVAAYVLERRLLIMARAEAEAQENGAVKEGAWGVSSP